MNESIPLAARRGVRAQASTRTRIRGALNLMAALPYLIPAFAVFIAFSFVPFFKTALFSVSLTNARGYVVGFEGLGHYRELFSSQTFYDQLLRTAAFVPMTLVPTLLLSLALSLMVQRVGHGSGLFRTLYSLPVAVSGAGAAMLFAALYDPSIGLLSHLFGKEILWLVDKRFALWAVAIVTVWQALGINFIFMLAGLQGIPEEQYESAALDGAGWWATTRYITLPGLMPTLFFLTVTGVIASLQAFGPINLLTLGGPEDSTMVLSYAIYREAFFNFRYDASSAMAMVFFVIMMGVTLVQFKLEGKGVHYGA